MKKIIYTLAFFFLFFLVLDIVLIKKMQEKKEENLFLIMKLNSDKSQNSALKSQAMYQQFVESMYLSDIELKNPKDKTNCTITSLLSPGHPKLFFRFRETDCEQCINNSMEALSDFVKYFPKNDLIILGGYKNARPLNAFKELQSFNTFIIENGSLKLDNQSQPYFFVLTDDLQIRNLFLICNDDSEYTISYLKCIFEKYWPSKDMSSH